jgi:polar amino acid transport system substrate-binding protein
MFIWRCVLMLGCAGVVWSSVESSSAESWVVSQIAGDQTSVKAFRIVHEAYHRLGIEVRGELLPNARALISADRGETDGDVIRIAGIEASYPNLVRVPEPVLNFETVAFTTGLTFEVAGWDSLRPYGICVFRGMKVAEQGTEGMNRTMANDAGQVIEMLRAGRCDVAVLGPTSWIDIDRLHAGPMRALEPPIATVPLFHYVNRRHADLAPRLAETLRRMREDGTVTALSAPEDEAIEAARRRNALPDH